MSVGGSIDVRLEPVDPGDREVRALYADFIREADGPLAGEVDLEAEIAAGPPAELVPPAGLLLIARIEGSPAGLGGVRHLDTEVAEVKSMFVAPALPRHRPRPPAADRAGAGRRRARLRAPSASTPPTT